MFRIAADPDECVLLERWLRADDSIGRSMITPSYAAPEADRMGVLVEALNIAVGPGGSLSAIATSIGVWASSRRRKMRMKIGDVEVSVDGAKDPGELAKELLRALKSSDV